jgi:peptidoglycan/xylan/chitin deacetylase (PgdA/CDA1 family)
VAGAAHEAAPSIVPPPPLERNPQTVDASALPDPAPPWPRLNPDDRVDRAWMVAEGPEHGPRDGRRLVTFTFDDGPFPETAPTVLKILDQHRIRATFFFIGEYLEGSGARARETREWAQRIADAGHYVGNHSMHHKPLTTLSHTAALAEIDDSAAAIERATGKRPWLFRPPYGDLDPWLEGALRDRQLELLLWNIDVEDVKREDPDAIVDSLKQSLEYHQGGVVLLHDMHWPSVKAFNRLVRWLESSRWDPSRPDRLGWDIVDLGEYLRATAAAPQPYARREDLDHARQAHAAERDHRESL